MEFVNTPCYNEKNEGGGNMLAKRKVDATQGPLMSLIFTFAIPLILTTLVQDLFNIADKAVLGNMAGSVAVAAIGATGSITGLIINGAVGLATGTTIVLARYVGQKNDEKIRSTIDTSLISSILLGIIVAALGVIFAPAFLRATDCPEECFSGALLYMRIYIAGAPFTLFYNYGAAILRTLGDTQRPLFYIIVSGIVNVVLNVILCLILPEKVAAVAIATITSKIISSVLVARRLMRFEDSARVVVKNMRFQWSAFTQIFRFGVPVSISNMVLPLANLQIVSAVNSYGVDAIAGNSAAGSVHTVVTAFSTGFGAATATFMGQNIGARNVDRVKKSFRYSFWINVLITGSLGLVMCLTGEFWLKLILGADEVAAINYGMIRMWLVTLFMFVHAANKCFTSGLQAFGYPFLTSVTNVVFTLGFRVLWMQVIYPHHPTFDMVMLCFSVAWIINMLFYGGFFLAIYRRYVKKGICKKI